VRGCYSVRPDAVHSAVAKDATSSERDPCFNDYVFPLSVLLQRMIVVSVDEQ
jgi:hypothetical protein